MLLSIEKYSLIIRGRGTVACDFAGDGQDDHAATYHIEDLGYNICANVECRDRLFRDEGRFMHIGFTSPLWDSVPVRPENVRAIVDGDHVAIVPPDFVNLQESDVIAWIPLAEVPA